MNAFSYETILVSSENRENQSLLCLALNRPEHRNALSDKMIEELNHIFLNEAPQHRAVILSATGSAFCAGVDLSAVRDSLDEQSHQRSLNLASLFYHMYTCAVPIIAVIEGSAYGGGVGLVAASHMAICANEDVSFCLPEVKLGLIPAVISPYLIKAMGERWARYYMLTGAKISATQAFHMGLVHHAVPKNLLTETLNACLHQIINASPQALTATEELIQSVLHRAIDSDLIEDTARRIYDRMRSPDAQTRIVDFFRKTKKA